MPTLLHAKSEAEWYAQRHQDVTSSEVAALFGMSPYLTAYELWHRKREPTPPDFADTERMGWGRTLERLIAGEVGRRFGVKVRRMSCYARHDETRMGANFDYEIIGLAGTAKNPILQEHYSTYGPGILECKNVDGLMFAKQWTTGDEAEAPEHIEVQVQHQLECIGSREWAVIATLVGGNRLYVFPRLRNTDVGKALVTTIQRFWARTEAPDPIMPIDAEFVSKMYQYAEPGKFLDARGRADILAACQEYSVAQQAERQAAEDKSVAKAHLLQLIGDTEKVLVDGFSISAGIVHKGEYVVKATSYRNLRVTKKEAK